MILLTNKAKEALKNLMDALKVIRDTHPKEWDALVTVELVLAWDEAKDIITPPAKFFVKDLSGRGYTATMTQTEIRKLDSWNETLEDFVKNAEVGEEFDGRTVHITRIE